MSDQTSADEARQEVSGRDEDERRRLSSTTGYEMHPLCTLFPPMTGAEFAALRDDIKTNGLRQMIVLKDGMILDGGNRYRACLEAGVTPRFVDYIGENLAAYVLSVNLHRRHMTPGQQAVIVASAQDWARAQTRGGDRKSDQSQPVDFDSVEKRSAASGASRVTQMRADKVAKADPELAVKVGHGEVSLPVAVAQVEAKTIEKAPKPKKVSPPADTGTVATAPEKHDETPGPAEDADTREFTAEMLAALESAMAENARLNAIVEADQPLAEAAAVIKQQAAEIFALRESNRALHSEKNEAIRLCKSHMRQSEKLRKILKGLGHDPK